MTTVVRTLPGHVDHDTTPTGAIPVAQVVDVDANDYDVRLDLSGHIDLIALIKALPLPMRIDMKHGTLDEALTAQRRARNLPAIRAALTVKLDPAEAGLAADSLAERLEQAALEPQRCEAASGDCSRFVTDDRSYEPFSGRHMCDAHLAQAQGD